jgi:hypothetical protein
MTEPLASRTPEGRAFAPHHKRAAELFAAADGDARLISLPPYSASPIDGVAYSERTGLLCALYELKARTSVRLADVHSGAQSLYIDASKARNIRHLCAMLALPAFVIWYLMPDQAIVYADLVSDGEFAPGLRWGNARTFATLFKDRTALDAVAFPRVDWNHPVNRAGRSPASP